MNISHTAFTCALVIIKPLSVNYRNVCSVLQRHRNRKVNEKHLLIAVNWQGLNEGLWEDRKQWSLGVGQRRKTFWNRYIYIYVDKVSLLDDIKTKQLQWYGHVQRMEEGRLPKEVMKWRLPGRRKRGRPKLTWAERIRGLMEEKGLMEEDWNDRSNRRKII